MFIRNINRLRQSNPGARQPRIAPQSVENAVLFAGVPGSNPAQTAHGHSTRGPAGPRPGLGGAQENHWSLSTLHSPLSAARSTTELLAPHPNVPQLTGSPRSRSNWTVPLAKTVQRTDRRTFSMEMKLLGNSTFLQVETFRQQQRLHNGLWKFSSISVTAEGVEDEPAAYQLHRLEVCPCLFHFLAQRKVDTHVNITQHYIYLLR